MADDELEDNTLDSASDSSLSLTCNDNNDSSEPDEFNLNCSFTGGYLPNTDLRRVDKGPQSATFLGI
jgi:hypothetical protein